LSSSGFSWSVADVKALLNSSVLTSLRSSRGPGRLASRQFPIPSSEPKTHLLLFASGVIVGLVSGTSVFILRASILISILGAD